ncbi:aminotransferase class IV [Pseudodonghicola flavimaris]|uniref:Probable branched-chain-amino-acid aminotransferase n=1 Tax=Pseudodonghicola flavimaris TaxID=3050036 RepID=A0ABT7F576_9RHOB|nr:aminotransferase class IV [Pseudodonghicola flavimaris]MDK3019746.1 aminotransferase class IV [Pseudodonghicola flavimaris]
MSIVASHQPEPQDAHGCAYVNGAFIPLAEAQIPMLDRGFVRSDATYDVTHIWKGHFFRLDDYIARFYASMAGLRMEIDESPAELRELILQAARHSGLEDAYVQMTCTRGVPPTGSRDPRMCKNQLSLFVQPFVWISRPEQQETGLKMVVAKTPRIPSEAVDQRIKNFHWLDLTRGIFEAYDQGADVAVHPSIHGGLTEGAGFNVFCLKGRTLSTPATGIFEGMTRRTVIELAPSHQLDVEVGRVNAEQLYDADEVFLTSTAGGVMPVREIDGRPVGTGRPGPITLALRKAYWDLHSDPQYSTPLTGAAAT